MSLKKTLERENLILLENLWYFLSITILGTLKLIEGDLTVQSEYSFTTITFLVKTSLTAVFQSTADNGK
mgnify:FL=1